MSGVRGPNSALTEFLRSQGISAAGIRTRYERRSQAQAASTRAQQPDESDGTEAGAATAATHEDEAVEQAIAEAAARKRRLDAEGPDPDGTARCAACRARFTLTVYTREVPGGGGGVLCPGCGSKPAAPKKKAAVDARQKRKRLAAALLDKRTETVPTLQRLCIEKVAEYINSVEELGSMSEVHASRIARIICKNRKLTPSTLQLFLRKDQETLELWDCSELSSESLNLIPGMCTNLKTLRLCMCGRMNGDTLLRLRDLKHLRHLELHGAFQVRQEHWIEFLCEVGPQLESLSVSCVYRFDAQCLAVLVEMCTQLQTLNLHRLTHMREEAPLHLLGKLDKLTHLELHELEPTALTNDALISILEVLGSRLQTLAVSHAPEVGDAAIASIGACCSHLTHLELVALPNVTDEALTAMFEGWNDRKMNRELTFVSLERCGAASTAAVNALLNLAQESLVSLNINSLRGVDPDTLDHIARLPNLMSLDLGFLGCVEPVHVYRLARGSLRQLLVYGNIRLSGMPLPQGLVVVGSM